jgi:hypothetical protein
MLKCGSGIAARARREAEISGIQGSSFWPTGKLRL